ncbi:MAG TPA: methyltransferase domain-containing protein [Fimbriimonas sp.]|nr:methyltransferase domain-containing protein [Fimbriimonas sp.]
MSNSTPTLAWTGERMIPFVSDYATQATHWQRYLYFRPWYEGAKVIDAAGGEGYGADLASIFAASAVGVDISEEAVAHAAAAYPHASFFASDACAYDYSDADLVTSFETIEHLPDPSAFLQALKSCKGRIVISTPNRKLYDPHAKLGDKPTNPYHTIEWTAEEFADLIKSEFPDRQVRFLSQTAVLPGRLTEGLDTNAWFTIAVIGDGELPKWPKIGISMPTVNNATMGIESISAFMTYYPGEIEFAVVLNGTAPEQKKQWREFAIAFPHIVTLIESPTNEGYGMGANKGLAYLQSKGGFDAYGVSNDDVYPSLGCLTELTYAFKNLGEMGQKPGIVGVTSNKIAGKQQVEIGQYQDLPSLMARANDYLRTTKSSATPWNQIRGLFFLMSPECLSAIGGFDPIYGLGNFEDDDLNVRCKLAGFTNWIVDGAFLYHEGSKTFADLDIDYDANIQRNMNVFNRKWNLDNHFEFLDIASAPEGVSLYVPLDAEFVSTHAAVINGEDVDLVEQALDTEFAYWVYTRIREVGPEAREAVLQALSQFETEAAA